MEPQDDMAVSSNVAKFMGLSMDGLTQMVAQGDTVPIMNAAFYSGELGAYVKNDFEPKTSRHIDYNNMSREELVLMSEDDIYPSMPNLDTVVQSMLTTEDVVSMIQGNQINIAVSLTKEEPSYETGVIMKSAIGQTPVCYFDLSLFKTTNGDTERISRLSGPMGVVIEIPDDIYKKGKTYSVLRIHNGELSVLPDVDNDPKTITFYTDRFSSYAIAKQVTSAHNLVVWLCAGAALTFGIAMTSFVILIYHQRKMRRQRRKH